MAEQPPSEKRRREARALGQVAASPLVPAAGALGGAALALWATGAGAWARLVTFARDAFSGRPDPVEALAAARQLLAGLALPVVGAALGGALLAGLAQTGGLWAPGALGRRSASGNEPARGLSGALSWALAAGLLLIGLSAARALQPLVSGGGVAAAVHAFGDALLRFVPRAIALGVAAGLGDWALRRMRLERALSMTRAEVERERREQEGDPRWKAERRRRHRALLGPTTPPDPTARE